MHLKSVENAKITCLVDNNVDILLPNAGIASRPSIGQRWFEHPLIAEHGFSVALKLEINGTVHTILFDSGLDSLAAAHNSDVLGFDLSLCEFVISSHGHIDHAGGLLNIRNRMSREQSIPLLFHEDAFRKRVVKFHDGRIINLPEPNKSVLTKAGYSIVERESPSLWLGDTVLVTGEIPRINGFEKGFPNHYLEVDGKMESG